MKISGRVLGFNLQEPCVLYIGRAYRYPPNVEQTYVKSEAAITVFELLMMSGVSLETC